MDTPLIVGLSIFSFITVSLGIMIAGIGSSTTQYVGRNSTTKDWIKHSCGFIIAAIPGFVVGILAFLFLKMIEPFLV